ncbi:MAG: Ig-like domain-containing protein [Chloroflexi bacterium]|nr:Ig-like domain-containing protein [Chloroflexota bacterium]
MRDRTKRLAGLIAGTTLALALVTSVAAYAGQVAGTVEVSGPSGAQPCGTPLTVTALVQETGGALIEGQSVSWSFQSGNVSGDKVLTATSTTNASGVATSQIQLACSPHSVVLGAVADEITGTTTIASSGEGLPRTDTAPTSSSLALLLAGMAVLVGAGMMLRRLALARR